MMLLDMLKYGGKQIQFFYKFNIFSSNSIFSQYGGQPLENKVLGVETERSGL